jgi:hypothetical protein
MIRFALFAVGLTVVSGCATPRVPYGKEHVDRGFEGRREFLIGKWVGETALEDGGHRTWLMERFPNGTFQLTIVDRYQGRPEIWDTMSEYGDWGLSGDIYFTMTRGPGVRSANTSHDAVRSSYYDDAYRISKLTAEEFRYTSVATNRAYTTRKVAADFRLNYPEDQSLPTKRN